MRYLHVMSRPKVIDHEHDTVWTEAYVDNAVSPDSRKKPFYSSYGCLCSMLTLLCVLSLRYSPHAAAEISLGSVMYIRGHKVNESMTALIH